MAMMKYEQDGQVRRTSTTFFRGEHVNFHPRSTSLDQPDFIGTYLAKGWMPSEGFVTKDTPVVAFGSCFASNISKHLDARGYNVLTRKDNKSYVTTMGDGIVHTFAIRQQFEWAWENKVPSQDLWHGYQAEDFGYSDEARQDTQTLFNTAELFIITLGLSEIWYDEPTGEVFWRAVPADRIDPSRHKFRVSTHAENLENLHAIRALIRKHRGDVPILFTLSPIPLTATFRPVSCVSANAVSKAILRGALDEFLRASADTKVFYFPSYEMVTTPFNHPWTIDRRHVYFHVLDFNMKVFEHYYCAPGIPQADLQAAFDEARRMDKRIGRIGHERAFPAAKPSASERRAMRKAAAGAARKAQRIAERQALNKSALGAERKAQRIAERQVMRKAALGAERKAERIAERRATRKVAAPPTAT